MSDLGIKEINKFITTNNVIEYHITGVLYRSNTRFKSVYKNVNIAFQVNIWRGSIWAVLDNGKRKLLKRVYN